MTESSKRYKSQPGQAPSAEEIERRFRSVPVKIARPMIRGGLDVLGGIRGYRWEQRGASKLRHHDGPLIFAANHRSHADTEAILSTLPRNIRCRTCVAAALDVFGAAAPGQVSLGRGLKREFVQFIVAAGFHAFGFDRRGAPHRSMRTAVEMVRNDWNLLLYPEGTRSRDCELGEFKPGVAMLAKLTKRPVVPIHVSGGETVLPVGRFMPNPGIAFVRYGEPMRFDPKTESGQDFTDRIRQRIEQLGLRQSTVSQPTVVESDAPLGVPSTSDGMG